MQFCHGWLLRKMWLKCCVLPLDLAKEVFVTLTPHIGFSWGNFWPFPAISGHVHGLRWSRMSFKHLFFSGNQCCFNNICPKIDIWGWSWSRWPILGHFRPFLATHMFGDGPRWASIVHFILGINIALQKFVLKSISEAGGAPDGQVLAVPGPPHGPRRSSPKQKLIRI